MPVVVVVGGFWGDEGKGKVIDYLAADSDLVVRFQGGDNAGHTVMRSIKNGDLEQIILHLVPSGVVQGKMSAIGSGVVLNPKSLMNELAYLEYRGINPKGNLCIDERANIVHIFHRVKDLFEEHKRSIRGEAIGTTAKGIGPCYTDMAARKGTRVMDFISDNLKSILGQKTQEAFYEMKQDAGFSIELLRSFFNALTEKETRANKELLEKGLIRKEHVDFMRFFDSENGFNTDEIFLDYSKAAGKIAPLVRDVAIMINEYAGSGKTVLMEGAQGTLLDVNLGTVPYVTSSHPIAGGAALVGIGPTRIDETIVVFKAYTTRVGSGPLPTRMEADLAEWFRRKTNEYGATTGRPRDVAWFDAVAARTSAYLNGADAIAITRLDDLSGFDELKICTAYKYGGNVLMTIPNDISILEKVTPIYETLPGFKEDISSIRNYDDLPDNAKAYVQRLKLLIMEAPNCRQTRLGYIGVGAERNQMIAIPK